MGQSPGQDGGKRKRGSKVHMVVDTMGELLALVVERSYDWLSRFRRLARDYERLATNLAGYHFLAFAILMAHRFVELLNQSHSRAPAKYEHSQSNRK